MFIGPGHPSDLPPRRPQPLPPPPGPAGQLLTSKALIPSWTVKGAIEEWLAAAGLSHDQYDDMGDGAAAVYGLVSGSAGASGGMLGKQMGRERAHCTCVCACGGASSESKVRAVVCAFVHLI